MSEWRIGPTEQRDPLHLLTLEEAAAILGVNWKAVREWVERGEIGCVRMGKSTARLMWTTTGSPRG